MPGYSGKSLIAVILTNYAIDNFFMQIWATRNLNNGLSVSIHCPNNHRLMELFHRALQTSLDIRMVIS